jgi:hypothetical protein
MNVLRNIDWQNHDGVNLAMINDFVRNQFYDRVLARYVKNQCCTDIGFGTGLLSMLALKHGADHVRAFESDTDRFALGLEIIRRLDLQNKIELINERYDNSYVPTPVTFSETVNGNLWCEGLWNSLPKNNSTVFLPGQYFLEVWAVEVPDSFARGLCYEGISQQYFSPGVDTHPPPKLVVNQLVGVAVTPRSALSSGIVKFKRQQETDWGWIPYMRAIQAGWPVATVTATHWIEDIENFVVSISTKDWKNSTVLIVPRSGMQQDHDRLYLDTGHWGPGEDPILLVRPSGNLVVRHSVLDGLITYSLE